MSCILRKYKPCKKGSKIVKIVKYRREKVPSITLTQKIQIHQKMQIRLILEMSESYSSVANTAFQRFCWAKHVSKVTKNSPQLSRKFCINEQTANVFYRKLNGSQYLGCDSNCRKDKRQKPIKIKDDLEKALKKV